MRDSRVQLRRIVKRDNGVCGLHIGGCLRKFRKSELTVDHIISQSYIEDLERRIEFDSGLSQEQLESSPPRVYTESWGLSTIGSDYRNDWNTQPMCKKCNSTIKDGLIAGYPSFQCGCHWWKIERPNATLREMYICERTGAHVKKHLFHWWYHDPMQPGRFEVFGTMAYTTHPLGETKGMKFANIPGKAGHQIHSVKEAEIDHFNRTEILRRNSCKYETER